MERDRNLSGDSVVEVVRGRVAWIETDAAGIYHFTNAFRWVEAAEAALFRRLGVMDEWRTLVRRHLEVELVRPLAFDDEYVVAVWPHRVGNTSVTLAFEIKSGDDICVCGSIVCVHVDTAFRSASVPDRLRSAFTKAER